MKKLIEPIQEKLITNPFIALNLLLLPFGMKNEVERGFFYEFSLN